MRKLLPSQRRYTLSVWLPMAFAAIYFLLAASDLYESTASFSIQQGNPPSAGTTADVLHTVVNQPSQNDALLLQKYILSPDLLRHLDADLKLREHYQNSSYDWLSRLSSRGSFEDFYSYFLGYSNYPSPGYSLNAGRIDVSLDPNSGIVSVSVRAYDAETAQKIVTKIVKYSSDYVNEIGRDMARQQTEYFQIETQKAAERVQISAAALVALQDKYHIINPVSEMNSQEQIIGGLETQLANQNAELDRLKGYLNRAAPELIAQENRVRALENQVQLQNGHLFGQQQALNALGLKYQQAQVSATLDADLYKATLSALQNSRMDSVRNLKHLAIVSAPVVPESALYPRRGYILATIFVLLHVLYGIASLAIATIKDHRD